MRQLKLISAAIEVVEREDGAAALELVKDKHNEFDLFVFDNDMPNMNGLDLIQSIRKFESQNKLLPIPTLCTLKLSFF